MSDKKSFVLRIDEQTYKALEKWAADEFRSVNGQIEWILHQHLKTAGRLKEAKSTDVKSKTKSWCYPLINLLIAKDNLTIIH